MDYELQNRMIIDDIGNRGMIYGSMPNELLMAKFEETNIDDAEDAYNDYARGLASNFGPDTNLFADEETRVNTQSGQLQLRYNGHRGDEEVNYRPEIFDGFLDRDSRAHNVDPDMKQYIEQSMARARFQLWTPDSNNSITGGGLSESQVMANKQILFKDAKKRLKIFGRQLDNGSSGKSVGQKNGASNVRKQKVIKSYGDLAMHADSPQRRATIMSRAIIRDTKKFRAETNEQVLEVQKYNQTGRRRQLKSKALAMRDAEFTADSDRTMSFKACGLLMADLVRAKARDVSGDNLDAELASSQQSAAIKTAIISRDITMVMRAMRQEGEFGAADTTMQYKTAERVRAEHLMNVVNNDHDLPAHHKLNAEIIYKNYAGRGNMRKIKDEIIRDSKNITPEHLAVVQKSKSRGVITGRKLATDADADTTDGKITVNYRSLRQGRGDMNNVDIGDAQKYEHAAGQMRRTTRANHKNADINDTDQMTGYDDNNFGNRHGGRLGTKYIREYDRDGALGFGETGLLTS